MAQKGKEGFHDVHRVHKQSSGRGRVITLLGTPCSKEGEASEAANKGYVQGQSQDAVWMIKD